MKVLSLLRKMPKPRRREPYLLPSELIEQVGWCQDVLRTYDEHGNVTGYHAGAAIDRWSRHPDVKSNYPSNSDVLMKREVKAISGKPILAFWNDDPSMTKREVIRVLRRAEKEFMEQWG